MGVNNRQNFEDCNAAQGQSILYGDNYGCHDYQEATIASIDNIVSIATLPALPKMFSNRSSRLPTLGAVVGKTLQDGTSETLRGPIV